jgi:hypothetical protein
MSSSTSVSLRSRAAEKFENRATCSDFQRFKPLFEKAESVLQYGLSQTLPFGRDACMNTGEEAKVPHGHSDARLRVIYANGTESNLVRRSPQRGLYKDEAGSRLTEPLFSKNWEEGDIQSGAIYVLRSLSDHPFVSAHRELIHKIGVTGRKVETSIANAVHDAIYLLTGVEVFANYKLAKINRTKREDLFHRIFSPAQLDLTVPRSASRD